MAGDRPDPGRPARRRRRAADAPAPPRAPGRRPATARDRVPPGAFAPRERDRARRPLRRRAARRRGGAARSRRSSTRDHRRRRGALVVARRARRRSSLDGDGRRGRPSSSASSASLAVTVGALLYAPLIMARTNGQTLGKMATGCRVVRADGRRIDFGWAALREVVVKALLVGIAGALTGGIAYLVDVPLAARRRPEPRAPRHRRGLARRDELGGLGRERAARSCIQTTWSRAGADADERDRHADEARR